MTTRQTIFDYTEDNFGVSPVYTFKRNPRYAILKNRHGKWFAAIINIMPEKLGLAGDKEIDIIDLKIEPELGSILRPKPGYLPAYHMNKEHWISIVLNEQTDEHTLFQLLDGSYELVTNN